MAPYLQEQLDGLGAGDTRGPAGDVLGDHAEGPVGGAIPTTVVLGQGGVRLSSWLQGLEGQGQGHRGGTPTYLGQCVLAAPFEAVALPIKGDEVAVPIGHAGAQAWLVAALPPAVPARAVRIVDSVLAAAGPGPGPSCSPGGLSKGVSVCACLSPICHLAASGFQACAGLSQAFPVMAVPGPSLPPAEEPRPTRCCRRP